MKDPVPKCSKNVCAYKTMLRVVYYCWCKQSCTSWYEDYPMFHRVQKIMGGAAFLKPSSVWMCANKKWHELTWISNKLLVSWWKKIQTCKLFTTEKQHSSHAFLSFPSLPSQLGPKAYDGHFEEVGQIQEAGYTEVLWWVARFLGEAKTCKKKPSTCGQSLQDFGYLSTYLENLVTRCAPKADRLLMPALEK